MHREKNFFDSASVLRALVLCMFPDPRPWHSCWAGLGGWATLSLSPKETEGQNSLLEMKLTPSKPSGFLAGGTLLKIPKFLGTERFFFFSYLIFRSLFCWFNVCFLLSQLVKLGWSVKLSRDCRFHFQGLKVWVWAFKASIKAINTPRFRVSLKLHEHTQKNHLDSIY